jgi:integrase
MIIHVVEGKGGKDRDLPLSPALLETLRAHWRWLKPRTYLFPSRRYRDREQPISDKVVWLACNEAAQRAGIKAALATKPNATVYSYPGQSHAFSRHNGKHYNAAAAHLANGRTSEFLDRRLR